MSEEINHNRLSLHCVDSELAGRYYFEVQLRACSSAGRAPRSQCGGREFDPPHVHFRISGLRQVIDPPFVICGTGVAFLSEPTTLVCATVASVLA